VVERKKSKYEHMPLGAGLAGATNPTIYISVNLNRVFKRKSRPKYV